MALEDILKAMEEQTAAEIARVTAQAKAEASAIIAQAEDEAKASTARQLALLAPRLSTERARLLSAARLAARREVAAAREAYIAEVFAAVQAELKRLHEGPNYPRYLALLTKEVAAELGAELSIVVNASDQALMRRIVADLKLKAKIATGLYSTGGLEAATPDGSVRAVNTFESRLERGRRHLRREIASLLAAEESCKTATPTAMPASGR